MEPIQTLRDDHERIEQALTQLESVLEDIERSRGRVVELLATLRKELDLHTYREDCLFPYLASRVGVTGGPVQAVNHDHDSVEENLEAMEAATDSLGKSSGERGTVTTACRTFIDELRTHFAHEEEVLFPMALQLLNDSEMRVVARQMESEE